jgi:hypothetical protein
MRKIRIVSMIAVALYIQATSVFLSAEAIAQERTRIQTKEQSGGSRETARIVREIRHELLTLPYYGVLTGWKDRCSRMGSLSYAVKS